MDPDLIMYRVVVLASWGWERTEQGWVDPSVVRPPLSMDAAWNALKSRVEGEPTFRARDPGNEWPDSAR